MSIYIATLFAIVAGQMSPNGDESGWVGRCELGSMFPPDSDVRGFAAHIAASGSDLIVAPWPNESAGDYPYIFAQIGDNLTQTARLLPPRTDEYFGWSVDIAGDVAVVGAVPATKTATGAAYVYRRDGLDWNLESRLVPAGMSGNGANFGNPVSTDGIRIAAVASVANDVYIFRRLGDAWIEEAVIPGFGAPIAIGGDTLAVHDGMGTIHIFRHQGSWLHDSVLSPSSSLGYSAIAMSADLLVAGADHHATDAGFAAGVVFVFRREGVVWVFDAALEHSDAAQGDELGTAVSTDGEFILAGAPLKDDLGNKSGAAYLFKRSAGGWVELLKIRPADLRLGDHYGYSTAISNGRAYVGSLWHDRFADEDDRSGHLTIFGVGGGDCDINGTVDTCQPDADVDTLIDSCDPCPLHPENDADLDGMCFPDDECPQDSTKTVAGECGCDIPETDSDSDGTPDCADGCPVDSLKTEPGTCGCGSSDSADSDLDNLPDCIDACPGIDDLEDNDANGVADCLEFAAVPAVSSWGIVCMALLLLTFAKLRRQNPGGSAIVRGRGR